MEAKTNLERSDWEKVIDDCLDQFKRMDAAAKSMNVARQCQTEVYELALKEINKYPVVDVKKLKKDKKAPLGVA